MTNGVVVSGIGEGFVGTAGWAAAVIEHPMNEHLMAGSSSVGKVPRQWDARARNSRCWVLSPLARRHSGEAMNGRV